MKVKLVILFALIWSACSLPTTPSSNERQSKESKQSAQTSSKQGAGQCQNPYQPVVQGASWKYEMKAKLSDKITQTISRVKENGFDLKMDFDSGVTLESSWECRSDGLINLDMNKSITGSMKGNQFVEGKVESMSGVTIPTDAKPGQTWDQKIVYVATSSATDKKAVGRGTITRSCKAVGFEQVQVPAGTFEALKVECSMKYEIRFGPDEKFIKSIPAMSFNSQDTQWMVAGVGMVKSASKTDVYNSEMNLLSYSIP